MDEWDGDRAVIHHANQHPIECHTDHSLLKWVKHASGKETVSQFIIDKLSVVNYNMHCIKGKDNVIADVLSRFPILGSKTLARTGLKETLNLLLTAGIDVTKICFDDSKDARHLINDVFE